MEANAIDTTQPGWMPPIILGGIADSQSPVRSSAHANSTQSCRPREALLSSGPLCLKSGTPFQWSGDDRFFRRFFRMKRSRIVWAMAGMAVSGIALAALWPHARDAGAILAAQDDPAALSEIQLNSAMRNN